MSWTITLWCNRADAEHLPDLDDLFADLADPPTLNVEEPDPDQPDDWLLTAYCNEEPDAALVARVVALFPSARDVAVAELAEQDWTTLSQRDLAPVRAGRFIVHTAAHADAVRPGDWPLAIEAGLAFGTGQHATTSGCLVALDRLARRYRFARIADIGTGTGVLAMAAAHAWPDAAIIASDIDPISITVTRGNLAANRFRPGRTKGSIELVVAAGMQALRLAQRAPYDLICANILAAPLIALAPAMSRAIAPGGVLVLAGLLKAQAQAVRAAYRAHGLVPLALGPAPSPARKAEWPCLVLEKRVQR